MAQIKKTVKETNKAEFKKSNFFPFRPLRFFFDFLAISSDTSFFRSDITIVFSSASSFILSLRRGSSTRSVVNAEFKSINNSSTLW